MPPRLRKYRRPAVAVATAFVLWFLGTAPGQSPTFAQPTVRIRAETRIELDSEQTEAGVRVSGVLLDDLGSPLPGQEVMIRAVSLDSEPGSGGHTLARARTTTDSHGVFQTLLPPSSDAFRIDTAFEGDALHDRMEVAIDHDARRHKLMLDVRLGEAGKLDLAVPSHTVMVAAHSQGPVEGIHIAIEDELGRELVTGVTDAHGTATFVLASSRLGTPGAGRIRARASETDTTSAALTEVPVVRFRHASVVLAPPEGRPTTVRGALRDTAGPLPNRAVGVFVDDAHLVTVITDEKGTFSAAIPQSFADGSQRKYVAMYESDAPGWTNASSLPLYARLGRAPLPLALWFALPMVVAALVLLAFRGDRPARSPDDGADATGSPTGAVLGPTSWRTAVRTVGGRVVDATTREAVPAVRYQLIDAHGERHTTALQATHDGTFETAPLRSGTYQLVVHADGYVPTTLTVAVPHRGEWSPVVIRLESLRARWLRPFRDLARGRLPQTDRWHVWTNREVAKAIATDAATAAKVAHLTHAVDEGYYGATVPTQEDAERLQRAVGSIADRVPQRPTPPR